LQLLKITGFERPKGIFTDYAMLMVSSDVSRNDHS